MSEQEQDPTPKASITLCRGMWECLCCGTQRYGNDTTFGPYNFDPTSRGSLYCIDGILRRIEQAIAEQESYPPIIDGYRITIDEFAQQLAEVVDVEDLRRRYIAAENRYRIPAGERIFCRNCQDFLGQSQQPDPPNQVAQCGRCGQRTCMICGVLNPLIGHTSCIRQEEMRDDEMPGERGRDYQRCPRCGAIFELLEACNNMTCKACSCQFCYICGEEASAESGHWDIGSRCPSEYINVSVTGLEFALTKFADGQGYNQPNPRPTDSLPTWTTRAGSESSSGGPLTFRTEDFEVDIMSFANQEERDAVSLEPRVQVFSLPRGGNQGLVEPTNNSERANAVQESVRRLALSTGYLIYVISNGRPRGGQRVMDDINSINRRILFAHYSGAFNSLHRLYHTFQESEIVPIHPELGEGADQIRRLIRRRRFAEGSVPADNTTFEEYFRILEAIILEQLLHHREHGGVMVGMDNRRHNMSDIFDDLHAVVVVFSRSEERRFSATDNIILHDALGRLGMIFRSLPELPSVTLFTESNGDQNLAYALMDLVLHRLIDEDGLDHKPSYLPEEELQLWDDLEWARDVVAAIRQELSRCENDSPAQYQIQPLREVLRRLIPALETLVGTSAMSIDNSEQTWATLTNIRDNYNYALPRRPLRPLWGYTWEILRRAMSSVRLLQRGPLFREEQRALMDDYHFVVDFHVRFLGGPAADDSRHAGRVSLRQVFPLVLYILRRLVDPNRHPCEENHEKFVLLRRHNRTTARAIRRFDWAGDEVDEIRQFIEVMRRAVRVASTAGEFHGFPSPNTVNRTAIRNRVREIRDRFRDSADYIYVRALRERIVQDQPMWRYNDRLTELELADFIGFLTSVEAVLIHNEIGAEVRTRETSAQHPLNMRNIARFDVAGGPLRSVVEEGMMRLAQIVDTVTGIDQVNRGIHDYDAWVIALENDALRQMRGS